MVGLVAYGMFSQPHPKESAELIFFFFFSERILFIVSKFRAHFEGDVIKVTEIFLGHKMQSNDTFIHHLGDPNTKQQVPQSTVLWLSVISGDVF